MSKKSITIYNKSPRKFVVGKGLVIKPKSHTDIPAELAKTLCEKYPSELSDVKVQTASNNAELAEFETAKAEFATEKETFEKKVKAFEEEKGLFELEKEEFEKAKAEK